MKAAAASIQCPCSTLESEMHAVQMRKKPDMKLVIPVPEIRLRPIRGGGAHKDKRRKARGTERVILRKELSKA
jgi:hypothetical protein